MVVAVGAMRANALSPGGAVAAVVVGVCAVAPGWTWGGLLLVFFLTSVGLTRIGRTAKRARAGDVIGKTDARNSAQVLANGGMFAATALALAFVGPAAPDGMAAAGLLAAAALGALCSATGDTWATEVGLLAGAAPRSIMTGKPVPPGMSGGVTLVGTAAGAAGAGLIAAVAALAGAETSVVAAGLVGGITGMLADSMLGASLQTRRWCDACSAPTERTTHVCGGATRHAGGLVWLGNDGVNALATTTGAVVAVVAMRAMAVLL